MPTQHGNDWHSRQEYKRVRKGRCEKCGSTRNLQTHHRNRRRLDNSAGNVVTLCAACHAKLHWRSDKR
jgi:hypothetical protein